MSKFSARLLSTFGRKQTGSLSAPWSNKQTLRDQLAVVSDPIFVDKHPLDGPTGLDTVRDGTRRTDTVVVAAVPGDCAPGPFDPQTVEGTITVAPGSVEMLLGPRLLAAILQQVPGVRLTLCVFN